MKSRVAPSAQCRSSIASSTGPVRPSRSSSASSASNRRPWRALSARRPRGRPVPPSSGSSSASALRVGPRQRLGLLGGEPARERAQRGRRAARRGSARRPARGTGRAARARRPRARGTRTRAAAASCRRPTRRRRTRTPGGRPRRGRARRRATSSSAPRPTKIGEVTRRDTPPLSRIRSRSAPWRYVARHRARPARRGAAAGLAPPPPAQPAGGLARRGRLRAAPELRRDGPVAAEPRAGAPPGRAPRRPAARAQRAAARRGLRARVRRDAARRRGDGARCATRSTPILAGHAPYPAVIVDRRWDLVSANAPALALLAEGVAPELLAPPANAIRVVPAPGRAGAADRQPGGVRRAPARPARAPARALRRRPGRRRRCSRSCAATSPARTRRSTRAGRAADRAAAAARRWAPSCGCSARWPRSARRST